MKTAIQLTAEDIKTAIWYYLTAKHGRNVDKVTLTFHGMEERFSATAELAEPSPPPKFKGSVPRD